jgi:hypothetical protein
MAGVRAWATAKIKATFYMVGGGSPRSAYSSELFRYDPQTNSWGGGPLSTGQVAPHRS